MSTKRPECVAFGKAVRRRRTALGISQEDLAHRTKIHRTYIGGIERGERNPTLTMIHRLAGALGIPPTTLLDPGEPQVAQ